MSSPHDRYLAQYSRETVEVRCKACERRDVETVWVDTLEREYGMSWLNVHEECPVCGADGDDLVTESAEPPDTY